MRTPDLFGVKPRKKYERLMHIERHGESGGEVLVEFECGRCGHTGGLTSKWTVAEAKRGIPCPVCNGVKDAN